MLSHESGHVRMCPRIRFPNHAVCRRYRTAFIACGYSVHSVQHALLNGYVPLAAGTVPVFAVMAVLNSEGEINQCAARYVFEYSRCRSARPARKRWAGLLRDDSAGGLLFAGPPACGKIHIAARAARVLKCRQAGAIVDGAWAVAPHCHRWIRHPPALRV